MDGPHTSVSEYVALRVENATRVGQETMAFLLFPLLAEVSELDQVLRSSDSISGESALPCLVLSSLLISLCVLQYGFKNASFQVNWEKLRCILR